MHDNALSDEVSFRREDGMAMSHRTYIDSSWARALHSAGKVPLRLLSNSCLRATELEFFSALAVPKHGLTSLQPLSVCRVALVCTASKRAEAMLTQVEVNQAMQVEAQDHQMEEQISCRTIIARR